MKTESQENSLKEIDLHQLVAEIASAKWLVIGIVIAFFIVGLFYATTRKPTYQTSALIQMDKSNDSISGVSGLSSILGSMTNQPVEASPSIIETTLLQSRYILSPVISSLNLDISASEHHFPLIGGLFSTPLQNAIIVNTLETPSSLLNKALRVIKNSENTYSVYDHDKNLLAQGELGKLLVSQRYPDFKVNISQLKGENGSRYNLEKIGMQSAISSMQKSFTVTTANTNGSANVNMLTDTGILTLTYTSGSPDAAVTVLNRILTTAYELGIKQQSIEAEHMIVFLNQQIPQVKKQMDIAQNALSDYQAKTGTLGTDNTQAQALLQQIVAVNQQLEQMKLDRMELLEKYTAQHPFVQIVDDKIKSVQTEMDQLEQKIHSLPEADKVAISLQREVKVKEQLYLQLLAKLQEMQVLSAGVISNMKILNTAYTPPTTIPTKKGLIVVISIILGLVVSIAIVIVKMLLHNGILDPAVIEDTFGIPVNTIIPHSKRQEKLNEIIQQMVVKKSHILAQEHSQDMAIESIRSLRTNLQLSMINRPRNIICISGLTPGIGKSFISLNLAYTLAQTNKDVLLIDIDIRKGKIHKNFGIDAAPGISDYLIKGSKTAFPTIYSHPDLPNLHFIPRGTIYKNPSELLQTDKLLQLFNELKKEYSTIIVDTPPILAVSDPIHIMKQADINFLVLSAGDHTLREIAQLVNILKVNEIKPDGAIFNFSKASSARTYYYYTGYSYKNYKAYANSDKNEKEDA